MIRIIADVVIVVGDWRVSGSRRHRADGIKVVRDQTLFRNQDQEAEFFEDGDLSDLVDGNGSEPATWVISVGDVDAVIGTDSDHWISIRLMEIGSAIDARSTDRIGSRLSSKAVLSFSNGTIQWRAANDNAFRYTGHGIIGKSGVRHDSKSEGFGILLVQGRSVACFGLDDFITPILALLGRRSVQGVDFSLPQVPDPEGEQQSLCVFGTFKGITRDERPTRAGRAN